MTTTLNEALNRAGIPVHGDDLLAALEQVGAQRLVQAPHAGTPLSRGEADVLAHASGVTLDPTAPTRTRARATAKAALMYTEALTTNEVADATGRSSSRVRHMATGHRLYTLPVDRRSGLLFPVWQFTATGQPLPGLAAVLAALPTGLHPLQVAGFFTTPTMELSVDDETPMTPAQWLEGGGDETAVVALAGAVGQVM